jgi:hypothetical protein
MAVKGLLPVKADERARQLEAYRSARCDVLRQGVWTSLDTVPEESLFLLSAWNPGNEPAGIAENIQHDARLLRCLTTSGIIPVRARGRGTGGPIEEGWLVPYDRERCLALLRQFGQVAGIVITPTGRTVLWADGSETTLDGDRCEVPAVPPVPRDGG